MSEAPLTVRPRARWLRRILLSVLALLALLLICAGLLLRASLPRMDGSLTLPGLTTSTNVQRDAQGTASIQAGTRLDLARALGFVHAQERFFEMDLTRRSAAGELAELFGERALERDKERRVHRMRARLQQRWKSLDAQDQALLQAYADGVNAGLADLPVRPWQYQMLRADTAAWQPIDSLLVISEMFFMLQAHEFESGLERALLRQRLGAGLYDWLHPRGGAWDAALDDSRVEPLPLPGPELLNLRKHGPTAQAAAPVPREELHLVGSNNWAVAGQRSVHGGALLADDMHLGLGVPSIWFRTQLELRGDTPLKAAGLSLPGAPTLVVGSNASVAWGFTNAYAQCFDWIALDQGGTIDAGALKSVTEPIHIKGGRVENFEVEEYRGWPLFKRQGKRYALRWIAHQGEAYNLVLDRMLQARDLPQALQLLQRSGVPHQNGLVADSQGHIGWTITGRLWARRDGLQTNGAQWMSPDAAETGWLAPADYPQLVDPVDGLLWTANSRQIGGDAAALLGDAGYDLGARAQQIRDRLREQPKHDEASLARLHLDHEARFMQSWAKRLLRVASADARHAEVVSLLKSWNGRADADSAAYRLTRSVRLRTLDLLWSRWTGGKPGEPSGPATPSWQARFEYPAAQALDTQPPHLLPADYTSWDALLLDQLDRSVAELTQQGQKPLARAVWGEQNQSRIQHVMAKAVPQLSRWLDMPRLPQPGDSHMPRVAGPAFGQSQRLVVSPGREAQGILVIAGGQSGHPLSPYYGAGHEAWAEGRSTPLLAGPPEHQLQLSAR